MRKIRFRLNTETLDTIWKKTEVASGWQAMSPYQEPWTNFSLNGFNVKKIFEPTASVATSRDIALNRIEVTMEVFDDVSTAITTAIDHVCRSCNAAIFSFSAKDWLFAKEGGEALFRSYRLVVWVYHHVVVFFKTNHNCETSDVEHEADHLFNQIRLNSIPETEWVGGPQAKLIECLEALPIRTPKSTLKFEVDTDAKLSTHAQCYSKASHFLPWTLVPFYCSSLLSTCSRTRNHTRHFHGFHNTLFSPFPKI
jgi:hypothetical protein